MLATYFSESQKLDSFGLILKLSVDYKLYRSDMNFIT